MKYTQVTNPQWANEEHTAINCEVDFDDLREKLVPFTAVAEGDYEHSHKIFAECLAGQYGEIAEYVEPTFIEIPPPPAPTKEELMQKLLEIKAQLDSM
jgi:hypothetical protein